MRDAGTDFPYMSPLSRKGTREVISASYELSFMHVRFLEGHEDVKWQHVQIKCSRVRLFAVSQVQIFSCVVFFDFTTFVRPLPFNFVLIAGACSFKI